MSTLIQINKIVEFVNDYIFSSIAGEAKTYMDFDMSYGKIETIAQYLYPLIIEHYHAFF